MVKSGIDCISFFPFFTFDCYRFQVQIPALFFANSRLFICPIIRAFTSNFVTFEAYEEVHSLESGPEVTRLQRPSQFHHCPQSLKDMMNKNLWGGLSVYSLDLVIDRSERLIEVIQSTIFIRASELILLDFQWMYGVI